MLTASATYAFDKQSARSFDSDGRMRVKDCVLSVAEVNPYYGREIPGRDKLGLDDGRVYDLYRDPGELAAAADSFNGLPLMIRHVAQTADEPRKEYQAGSVYNTRFESGKLRGDLLVSDAKAIELIQAGELADLSSSYRYTPDMTPGTVAGKAYHGRMVGIEGNHVALVEDGRATGAHVADSALSQPDGGNPVDPTETPNPEPASAPTDMAAVAQALMLLTQKLEGIEGRLAKIEGDTATNLDLEQTEQADLAGDESSDEAKNNEREGEEAAVAKEDKDKADERAGELRAMDAKSVRSVVDAAVKAERARAAAVDKAKSATRHVLGDMIAMDSAGDIYRAALKQAGVDVASIGKGVESIAWDAYCAATRPAPVRAMDARPAAGEKPAFDLSHIRVRG